MKFFFHAMAEAQKEDDNIFSGKNHEFFPGTFCTLFGVSGSVGKILGYFLSIF